MATLPLAAFALTTLALYLLLRTGLAGRLAIDLPNHRSLHMGPIPRIGGIVMVPCVLLAWTLAGSLPLPLVLIVAGLCLLSYLDDRSSMPVVLRLAGHLAAAAAMLLLVLGITDPVRLSAAVLTLALLTNLYNFMDGADGLAGGMALLGFAAYAWAAAPADLALALACACVAAAAAGFLVFNFPPARVFLGDAGSVPLGFAAAALGALGVRQAAWPIWFPLLVFSPFYIDAGVTLLRRIGRGERFWQAHREHYYQRLIRMGWSHRRTALAAYLLMAGVALSAELALQLAAPGRLAMLLAWCAVYALGLSAVDRRWQRFQQSAVETR